MKMEVIEVTPRQAKEWLDRNVDYNRSIRSGRAHRSLSPKHWDSHHVAFKNLDAAIEDLQKRVAKVLL